MAMLTSLESYWSLGEASGNRADSHGSNTLADAVSVASATGKVGDAADFERGDNESLSIADNASLSVGDIDFSFALWINAESIGTNRGILSKYVAADIEYLIWENVTGSGQLTFLVRDAANTATVQVDSTVTPTVGAWHLIIAWHDSVNNEIAIQVDNATPVTTSHSGGCRNGATSFRLGNYATLTNLGFDGLIDEVAFAKRVWTSDERTWIYNSGSGRSYADWAATESPTTVRSYAIGGGFGGEAYILGGC